MGLFGLITSILPQISHRQSHFESLKQYYFGKPYICLGVQSHPKDQGDFEQASTLNISECNTQLELSTYNMCCSYMVLTNPHMKHWIQFIIMKIFMKIVKICPKSPWFTVTKLSWLLYGKGNYVTVNNKKNIYLQGINFKMQTNLTPDFHEMGVGLLALSIVLSIVLTLNHYCCAPCFWLAS